MATTRDGERKLFVCAEALYQDFLFDTLMDDPPMSVRDYLNELSPEAADQLGAYIASRLAEVDAAHLLR